MQKIVVICFINVNIAAGAWNSVNTMSFKKIFHYIIFLCHLSSLLTCFFGLFFLDLFYSFLDSLVSFLYIFQINTWRENLFVETI